MKEKIDKTKENIGVDNLDQKTRKELFEKFVDGGGDANADRRKRRPMVMDRDKQKDYQTRLDSHYKQKKSTAPTARKAAPKKTTITKKTSDTGEGWFTRAIKQLKVSFRLKFMKITKSRGYYFNLKFLERFNNSFKPALMEIQVIYLDLFRRDPSHGRRITQRLDKANPLLFEIIEMIGSIYDKMTADQIVDHYVNFPDVPKKVSDLKDPLIELFRRLYLLKPYENTILNAFFRAYEISSKLEGEKPLGSTASKRKIKNSLFIIFHKLYPRLHWLLCHYSGRYIEPDSLEIEDILNIAQAEKPGNRSNEKPEEGDLLDLEMQGEGKTSDDPDVEELSEEIKRGLHLMYQLDMKELRKLFDKKRLFEHISDSDKVMLTFLLFSEFDREYSVLLTTNKIKYNVDFTQAGKFNFGVRLHDLYDEMRRPGETLRDYGEIVTNFEKVRRQKPAANDQYIAYSKRLQEMQQKRNQSGKTARQAVMDFMLKLSSTLEELIEDMDSSQKFLSNPQEELQFDDLIEGDKKLNNTKVYNAIQIVYDYTSAFIYRLSPGGDLSGKIEDENKNVSPQSEAKKMQAPATPSPSADQPDLEKDGDSSRSIIEELDDLL